MAYLNAKQLNFINILIDMCLINKVILMTVVCIFTWRDRANNATDYSAAISECGFSKRLYFLLSCSKYSLSKSSNKIIFSTLEICKIC